MIVVDTNILAYLLLDGERTPQAQAVMLHDPLWCAPSLWRSEFNNVLSIYLRQGRIDTASALRLCAAAERRIAGHEYRVPAPQILSLVTRSTCSAYDCEFVALALDLGLPLITEDRRILDQFPEVARDMTSFLG